MSETYDIKIHENKRERETIRGLSYAQMQPLRAILTRYNVDFHLLRRKIVTRIAKEGDEENEI